MTFARRLGALAAALVLCLLAAPAAARAALVLPAGFEERTLAAGLNQPTAVAWLPDGRMLVTEKQGAIRIVSPLGVVAPAPLVDLRAQVSSNADRGLLGLAVDPDFAANGYVYVAHTFQHDPASIGGRKTSRLLRLTVAGTAVVARKVLLGTLNGPGCPPPSDDADCLPSEGLSHSIGTVRAAPDGTLWLGSGDAAGYSSLDRLALRTHDERSMAGKLLHVDREGRGLPGHPFCPGETDLDRVCTKIAAKGFRNPFRFVLHDGGALVGDVGWNTWEELDFVTPGADHGWPCYEGAGRTPLYQDLAECQARYAEEGTAAGARAPAHTYLHTAAGGAVQAGPRYAGTRYPEALRGRWFMADYGQRWIRTYELDAQGRLVGEPAPFASDYGGVDLELSPSGDLVWVDIESGSVRQIVYSPTNASPVAVASATPASGMPPLRTQLSSIGSRDPDADPLSFTWDFGDSTPLSTAADPVHTYTARGRYTATLTVRDGRGGVASATVGVTVGDAPPVPRILAPADGARYRDGRPVALRGEAVDDREGRLDGARLSWRIALRHGEHLHPVEDLTGAERSFVPFDDHDADAAYEVTLTARDAAGLSASTRVVLRPETIDLALRSEPEGATLSYGGRDFTGTRVAPAAVGFRTTISAAPELVRDGRVFAFDHWSDGGARLHDLVVPPAPTTLTAHYRQVGVGVAGSGGLGLPAAPAPRPAAGGTPSSSPVRGGARARVTLRAAWTGRRRAPARHLRGRLSATTERLTVLLAVGRAVKGSRTRCAWWGLRRGGFGRPASCTRPAYLPATVSRVRRDGGWSWRVALRGPLPRGSYRFRVRTLARDGTVVPSRLVRVAR